MLSDIAQELVTGCREGNEMANLDRLYAPDAVSVEGQDHGSGRETVGLEGIRAKHEWWAANMEVTAMTVSDPMLHGSDRFAVIFDGAGHSRADGAAFRIKEVAVYTVSNGQIVREEFFG